MNGTDYFGDREILNDLLISEKHLSDAYNTNICESTSQAFGQILENILNETHKMHSDIWEAMVKRGWYKTRKASSQEIEMIKHKFEQLGNKHQ